MRRRLRDERGFVFLTELVVVLALAGILLSVAVPAWTHHLRSGRDTADKAALATISMALESYADDHFDVFPQVCDMQTLGCYVRRWPLSQSDGEPMHEGTKPGEYSYQPTTDLLDYDLVLHLRDGSDWVLPAGIKPTPSSSP